MRSLGFLGNGNVVKFVDSLFSLSFAYCAPFSKFQFASVFGFGVLQV